MSENSKKVFKLIPALDVTEIAEVERIARAVGNNPMVYGFKVGFSLGLTHGLAPVVEAIRKFSNLPVIYDHQKAATDIPDTGTLFARTLSRAGIDEAILFPQAGPATLTAWIKALRDEKLKIIVGGLMTHPAYRVSEGGFIEDAAIEKIYSTAVENGVSAFVVPLTKPEAVEKIVDKVPFPAQTEFYSPGFGRQGGDPKQFSRIGCHYLIVGRALIQAPNAEEWLNQTAQQLRSL